MTITKTYSELPARTETTTAKYVPKDYNSNTLSSIPPTHMVTTSVIASAKTKSIWQMSLQSSSITSRKLK